MISEGRALVLSAQKEAPFQAWVIRYAKFQGWRVSAMHDSRKLWWGSDPGFPDLVLVRGARLLACELKVGRNQPRPEQDAWLESLKAAGAETFCWHPADEGEIRRVLA